MNRHEFFERIRREPFGGSMTQEQVDGVNKILDYRDAKYPLMLDAQLAYLLATVFHETARTMQPITEQGSRVYLRSRAYWPWIGRGLVQITHEYNFRKFGILNPEDALKWPVALDIAFRGMVKGMFTGRKLSQYIDANYCDYINARRIINGTDRAVLVAGYAESFRDAFKHARLVP